MTLLGNCTECLMQFDTSEMTGRQKPDVRKTLWKSKRVFFCTPQVFEKDLANGKDVHQSLKCSDGLPCAKA